MQRHPYHLQCHRRSRSLFSCSDTAEYVVLILNYNLPVRCVSVCVVTVSLATITFREEAAFKVDELREVFDKF